MKNEMNLTGGRLYVSHRGAAPVAMRAGSAAQANKWCHWLHVSLVQVCYPLLEMADVERADMMEKLRKSPLYRYRVKMLANAASQRLHSVTEGCLRDLVTDPLHDFAAHVESGIQKDVLDVRNALSEYMQKHGSRYASILSRLSTVRALIELETVCYDRVCDIIGEGTGGGCMRELYGYIRGGGLLHDWDALSDEIERADPCTARIDTNQCKKAKQAGLALYRHAFESDLLVDALNKARAEAMEAE